MDGLVEMLNDFYWHTKIDFVEMISNFRLNQIKEILVQMKSTKKNVFLVHIKNS